MELETYFEKFNDRDWEPATEPKGGPVRLAVIGLGEYARERSLPAIEQTNRCETTVVVSSSPEKAETVATRFGADHILNYDDFHAGEAAHAYDAVYIATPPAFHLESAETAAEYDKHVLCEKPMATTVEQGQRIVRTCEDANVMLMVAYRLQTEPAVRRLRELIQDGFIGVPVGLYGQFSIDLLGRAERAEEDIWRINPEIAGGGALMDLGIYPLNTSRFLLGEDPIAVQATTASPHEEFAGVDEHATFQVSFPNDVMGSFSASFNAHRDSQLKIVGSEGRVLIDSAFGGLVNRDIVVERGDMHAEFTGPSVNEIVEQFEYFATQILSSETLEPDGAHGLTDLEVLSGAYESSETNSRVTFQ